MSTVTDCLRIYELVGEPLVKYLVEGGYLYTDDNTIAVRYIKKSTDPTKFPLLLLTVWLWYHCYGNSVNTYWRYEVKACH